MTWNDYDEYDPDAPQDIDLEESAACPACGGEIHEDAPRCPHCGRWITDELAPGASAEARARGWFWPVMVALLISIILVMWIGLGR